MAATTQETNDFYKILGVSRDADADVIEAAFLALKLKHDLGYVDVTEETDSDQSFPLARQAYDVLSNPFLRQLYDKHTMKIHAAENYSETHAKVLQCEDLTERVQELRDNNNWVKLLGPIGYHMRLEILLFEERFNAFDRRWVDYVFELLKEHKAGTWRECTPETSDYCSWLLELYDEFSEGLAMFEHYMRALEEASLKMDPIEAVTLMEDFCYDTCWDEKLSNLLHSEAFERWRKLDKPSDNGNTSESEKSQPEGSEDDA
ncbi:hypothetical protein GGR57DRAFT_514109 [Xylariaceae sp. FL1272]|nr:hypothetical protein GGR57DRAFT_514109 [Xylariaceae sp. FL1272]